jgi:membrane protein YdbS with pleckstrin-like domain
MPEPPKDPLMVVRPRLLVPVIATILGWTAIVLALLLTVQAALPQFNHITSEPGVRGFLAGIVVVIGLAQYLVMRHTEYRVYSDTLEYREFAFTQSITVVPMKRITSITMTRDLFIDRIFNTGTISFLRFGSEEMIDIPYVHFPKETFARLLEIQSKATPLGPAGDLENLKDD